MLPAIAISNPKGLNSGSASSTKRSRMWYWIELQRTQSPRVIRTSSQRPKTTKTKRYQDYNPSSLSVTISRFVPFGSSRPPQRHFTQLTSLLGRRRASAVPTPRQTSRPCRRGELPHALSAPDITHRLRRHKSMRFIRTAASGTRRMIAVHLAARRRTSTCPRPSDSACCATMHEHRQIPDATRCSHM